MPRSRIGTAGQNLLECTRSAETLTLILREIEKHYSLVSKHGNTPLPSSPPLVAKMKRPKKKLTAHSPSQEDRLSVDNPSGPDGRYNPPRQPHPPRRDGQGKGKDAPPSRRPLPQADEHRLGMGPPCGPGPQAGRPPLATGGTGRLDRACPGGRISRGNVRAGGAAAGPRASAGRAGLS